MSPPTIYTTGDEVEVSVVVADENGVGGLTRLPSWLEARVVRFMPKLSRYTVDYDAVPHAADPSRRLRETVDAARLRPRPPCSGACSAGRRFHPHQPVEARRGDGWCLGIVTRVLGECGYVVCFPIDQEELEFSAVDLRIHLEWVGGKWIHPHLQRAKEAIYGVGNEVEVAHIVQGSPDAWFSASILKQIWKDSFLVEYDQRLQEDGEEEVAGRSKIVDRRHIRPRPSPSLHQEFVLLDEVEAFYDDGWRAGVVTEILAGVSYRVESKFWSIDKLFAHSELRHRFEWIDGQWVRASKVVGNKTEVEFKPGALVEVRSDEEGFVGSWFNATILKPVGRQKFLVEYRDLRTDDENEPLKETVELLHVRPHPPDIRVLGRFKLLEEVDALYNDGWWVGVISKVLNDARYKVYFKSSSEEMEFGHEDLRLHYDWMNGKWLRCAQVLGL